MNAMREARPLRQETAPVTADAGRFHVEWTAARAPQFVARKGGTVQSATEFSAI
jgi:hypothetical protein